MKDIQLGLTKNEKYIINFVLPLLGAVAGWYLPVLARWILNLPWLPYEGIIEKIASYSGTTPSIILCIAGIVAGIILSQFIFHETLQILVNKDSVTLMIKDTKDQFRKGEIQSIFLDGKSLVLVGLQENEMFKEEYDGNKKKMADAFLSLGYPWSESDPYLAAYCRWNENDLQIPAAVHALLRTRKSCLENEQEKIAKQVQLDLAKIGVAIKDRKKDQYIRLNHSLLKDSMEAHV